MWALAMWANRVSRPLFARRVARCERSGWRGAAAAGLAWLGVVVVVGRPGLALAQQAPAPRAERAAAASGAAPAPSRAAQLFDSGVADLKLGNYESSCAALEQSYALEANLGTLIALGDCLERWGKLRSAAARFEELVAAVSSASSAASAYRAPQLDYARAALARLEPQIPRLSLAFSTPLEPGVRVLLDGRALPSLREQELGVDPGHHSIETQAPDREPWRIELSVNAGERRRVELRLGSAPEPEPASPLAGAAVQAPPPPSAAEREPPAVLLADTPELADSPWRTVGWGLGGLGVAGLGVSAVAGVMVLETCPGLDCEGNRGKHLALVTDIGLGVGLAALAASVYILLETEPPPKPAGNQSWRPLGSLHARGGWLGVGHSF
jgi:hypothetical protein